MPGAALSITVETALGFWQRQAVLDADAQLVERCLGGEEAAWEDLVRLHSRRVYGICFRFTGSGGEAQDIAQDVFLRVFQSLKCFRAGEGSFQVWLARLRSRSRERGPVLTSKRSSPRSSA